MAKTDYRLAREVQWVDPSGEKMLLSGRLQVAIEQGAVEIEANDCLLKRSGSPGGTPAMEVKVERLHLTIAGSNCRIDWE